MASDAAGNVYVAGTTSSPDLPVKNAAQPSLGEALLMRSLDRGATWQNLSNPPTLPFTITPHPSDPRALFIGGIDGIYTSYRVGRGPRVLQIRNADGTQNDASRSGLGVYVK